MATETTNTGRADRRSIAWPLNAFGVLLVVGVVNLAVFVAGQEWFVQEPSLFVPVRNVGLVLLVLVVGRLFLPARNRSAESVLLLAGLLFGIGLAMQFRLGHDAPRQLSDRDIQLIADTVRTRMSGVPEDSVTTVIRQKVAAGNSALRRDFDQARIDVRLARSLQDEYGPSDTTSPFLEERATAPMDSLFFRLLPVLAGLLGIWMFARSRIMQMLTLQWRAIGLYGSLGLCIVTFFYLNYVGGIRGASVAPQELLKLTVPIAWAGILIHYRNVFTGKTLAQMTRNPLTLWLYVLGLLALPLVVFVAVRDFGQFLAIGIAQILLLAWYTRNSLYVVLFASGLAVATVVLLGDSIIFISPLLLIALILATAGLLLAYLEKFRGGGTLWPTATGVLTGFGVLAWLASQMPFVNRLLATPRSRFGLWADLYSRDGDPAWWDNSRQIVESLYAFDAGGLFGRGLGQGSPFLVPKAGSDFIFAAFVEELGLVGGLLIIMALATLVVVGLRIANERGRGSFAGLLVAGYVLLIGSQTFVHIAGTMNAMPMTGITLPLMSSGMSSLTVTWIIIGVVVGIAAMRRADPNQEFTVRKDLSARNDDFIIRN